MRRIWVKYDEYLEGSTTPPPHAPGGSPAPRTPSPAPQQAPNQVTVNPDTQDTNTQDTDTDLPPDPKRLRFDDQDSSPSDDEEASPIA